MPRPGERAVRPASSATRLLSQPPKGVFEDRFQRICASASSLAFDLLSGGASREAKRRTLDELTSRLALAEAALARQAPGRRLEAEDELETLRGLYRCVLRNGELGASISSLLDPYYPVTKALSPEYAGEDVTPSPEGTLVRYLGSGERPEHELHVRQGLICRGPRAERFVPALIAETFLYLLPELANTRYNAIFVMDSAGKIYTSDEMEYGIFHHSTFPAGGPVAGAGRFYITDGRLQHITDHSGHYRPSPEMMLQLVCRLEHLGLDLQGVTVHLHDYGLMTVPSFKRRMTSSHPLLEVPEHEAGGAP